MLIKSCARVNGTFKGLMPSPLQIANYCTNDEVKELIVNENAKIVALQNDTLSLIDFGNGSLPSDTQSRTGNVKEAQKYIPAFGDEKTCSNIRSVRNRSPHQYDSFSESPRDFHSMGYLMQSLVTVYGASGLYYICRQILGRKKVTPKSFKKIFIEGNYERNLDALFDCYWGMGLALIKEFQCSDYFPTQQFMDEVLHKDGNLNKLLLRRFNGWVEECSTNDSTFSHQAKAVTYELPLLKFFFESVRNGNGASLEAVWLELLPLFAGTNKRNYKDEAFVHIFNFVVRWPKPVRLMHCTTKQNSFS